MIFYKNLAERCAAKRKEAALTSEELAQRAGLSVETIESFENGNGKIMAEDFFKILNALDIELSAAI